MSRDIAYRISALVIVGGVALLLVAFCTGCTSTTTYKYTTRRDGTVEEKLKIGSDLNLERIDYAAIEQPSDVQPVTPPGFARESFLTAAPQAPLGFLTASGATFWARSLDNSSPSHVRWAGRNRAIRNAIVGAVSAYGMHEWGKTARLKDANDLTKAQSDNKLKAFETKEAAKTARNADDNATRLARELGREP